MRGEKQIPEKSATALSASATRSDLTDDDVAKLMVSLVTPPPGLGTTRYWLVPRFRKQTFAEHLSVVGEKLECRVFGPDSAARPISVSLERIGDQPPRFRLHDDGNWLVSHSIESLYLASWSIPTRRAERSVTWYAPGTETVGLASLATEPDAAIASPILLAKLAADELDDLQKCSAEEIAWEFRDGSLTVKALRDPAKLRVPLIAELAYADADNQLRRLRHVLRADDEGGMASEELALRLDWSVQFDYPTETLSPHFQVCVREAEPRDLVLFDDFEFDEALLTTRYMPIIAEPIDDVADIEFTAAEPATQELIASKQTAWILNVRNVL